MAFWLSVGLVGPIIARPCRGAPMPLLLFGVWGPSAFTGKLVFATVPIVMASIAFGLHPQVKRSQRQRGRYAVHVCMGRNQQAVLDIYHLERRKDHMRAQFLGISMAISLGIVALAAGGVNAADMPPHASAAPGCCPTLQAKAATAKAAQQNHDGLVASKVRLVGMTCAGCAVDVQRALKAVPGVKKVEVSLQSSTATVLRDPQKATPADLVKAVNAISHRGRRSAFRAISIVTGNAPRAPSQGCCPVLQRKPAGKSSVGPGGCGCRCSGGSRCH